MLILCNKLFQSPPPDLAPGTKNCWISSYNTKTMDAPIPLNTFDRAPLKNAFYPSDLAILTIQSKVLLYNISALPIIIVIISYQITSSFVFLQCLRDMR